MLLDNGVDLHSFQPTANDMVTISGCDLFIYTGGESDAWVEDALSHATNPDLVAVNLMDLLGDQVKAEETVEGMQETAHLHSHEDEPHDEHTDEHDEHEHSEECTHAHDDEHIWLSLKHAVILCNAIADTLGQIDPDHRDAYAENASAYIQKLTELDGQYQAVVDSASNHTLLFADRFPFRYLMDDYGLSYYAAFSGCSAETEASFETVAFLAEKWMHCRFLCADHRNRHPQHRPHRGGQHHCPKPADSCSPLHAVCYRRRCGHRRELSVHHGAES